MTPFARTISPALTVLLAALAPGCRSGMDRTDDPVFGPDSWPGADDEEGETGGVDVDPPVDMDEPTTVVDGVEFYDPNGALDGVELEVSRVPSIDAHIDGEVWSIEPSMALDHPIFVRFPTDSLHSIGDELLLYTEADGEWIVQSVGTMSNDGYAEFEMHHFSHQAVAGADACRSGFKSGNFCDGSAAAGPAFVADQTWPGPAETSYSTPITAKGTHERAVSRLHDLRCVQQETIGDIVFKQEECKPAKTGCWKDWNPSSECAHQDEDFYGDRALLDPLANLAHEVGLRSGGTLALRITEAFDSGCPGMDGEHSSASLHYEGRALDLTLSVAGKPDVVATDAHARLAQLASQAGFDWVAYEVHTTKSGHVVSHVHVSVSPLGAHDHAETCFDVTGDWYGGELGTYPEGTCLADAHAYFAPANLHDDTGNYGYIEGYNVVGSGDLECNGVTSQFVGLQVTEDVVTVDWEGRHGTGVAAWTVASRDEMNASGSGDGVSWTGWLTR